MLNQNFASDEERYDVIILGGGAAGLMCAITAGQRGKRVLVIECSNKLGKKILMSGGGRCNFTNLEILPEHYLSSNPHFFKSALQQYTQWDFITLVAKHQIAYHEKADGQLFCDESSKQILAMLEDECQAVNVDFELQYEIEQVEFKQGDYWLINSKQQLVCKSLVVATGGLSIPTLGGATGLGYKLAQQFKIPVVERLASLVPVTLTGRWHELSKQLSGVSLPVRVSVPEKSFVADMLFTHRGLSGPAILQLSNYWQLGQTIEIDFLIEYGVDEFASRLQAAKKKNPNLLIRTYLTNFLPKSVAQELLANFFIETDKFNLNSVLQQFRNSDFQTLANYFKHCAIKPSGTEGYRTAEVTKGGVDVNYLSSKTMEVKHQKGLFFIGEVVDVTGHLGGYNFQWAWSSGYVAGLHI